MRYIKPHRYYRSIGTRSNLRDCGLYAFGIKTDTKPALPAASVTLDSVILKSLLILRYAEKSKKPI